MGIRKGLGEVGKKEQEGRGQLVTQRCSPRQLRPQPRLSLPLLSSPVSQAGPLIHQGERLVEVHVAVPRRDKRRTGRGNNGEATLEGKRRK